MVTVALDYSSRHVSAVGVQSRHIIGYYMLHKASVLQHYKARSECFSTFTPDYYRITAQKIEFNTYQLNNNKKIHMK